MYIHAPPERAARNGFDEIVSTNTYRTSGQGWIRTIELVRGQIYSLLPLAAWLPTHTYLGAREGNRTPDLLITNQLLYQLSYSGTY